MVPVSDFIVRALIAAALVILSWLLGGWALALVGVALSVPLFVRTQDGRIWYGAITTRLRFLLARARGRTQYDGTDALPHPLSGTVMVREEPYAVLAHEHGFFSVVVDFDPQRSDWLAQIADAPGLVSVSITTQTGTALATGFTIAESAGALTRSVLREALSPTASLPAAWACLTWHGQDFDISRCVDTVEVFITAAGLEQPLTGATVAALVSTAYSPDREPVTDWEHAGPGSAHELRNRYRHANVTSVVWRVAAGAADLSRLLCDQTAATLERVTAVYTPQPGGRGLRQTLVLTVTCPQDQSLAVAASAMRSRAHTIGLSLSPCASTMASCFAVGLGVGVRGDLR
jgi:hypothetical protein